MAEDLDLYFECLAECEEECMGNDDCYYTCALECEDYLEDEEDEEG